MSFKKKVIKEILNHANVVDVIGHFLPIKRKGHDDNKHEYVTLCPFHNEKTPSFTITERKQFYHCFGCGAHGNAIDFVVEFTLVTYSEAIIEVAKLCNFKLPIGKTTPSKKKISDRKKRFKKLKQLSERKIRINNASFPEESSEPEEDIPWAF